jgi:hypothetical protein
VDEKARVAKDKRRSRTEADWSKMKRKGMEARFDAATSAAGGDPGKPSPDEGLVLQDGEKWLECQVVRELPLLWVKRSNLAHGTVMLYNGET